MGLVDRIERKLESTLGDAFARVFGGSIVPQEVEAMLRREADAGVRELAGGRILAPNDYVITLSVPDYQKVSADPDLTSTTFAKHLEGYIHEQGWQTYGDVVVRFEQSANLHTGQFRARGAVDPDSTTGQPAPALRDRAFTAEPGEPMTDNPSYRGQGQGRPDEYNDDRYGRPEDREGGQDPRGQHPPDQRGYPPPGGEPGYGQRPGYPDQGGGYPEQGGYPDQGGGYPDQAATRRRPMNSVRPPATAPLRAATRTRAIVSRPVATRRRAASPATAAVTTAVSSPRRGRRTTAVRTPGRPIPIRVAIRRSRAADTRIRATAASPTAARTSVMELSPIMAATASPRRAAATPSRDTESPRAADTTTVPQPVRPVPATAAATAKPTTHPAARTSPFSSTTAAAGPTSCARAPT